jgi:hypothetical protein
VTVLAAEAAAATAAAAADGGSDAAAAAVDDDDCSDECWGCHKMMWVTLEVNCSATDPPWSIT